MSDTINNPKIEELVASSLVQEIDKEPTQNENAGAVPKQIALPPIEGLPDLIEQFLSNARLEKGQVSHYTKTDVLPVLLNPTKKFRLYNADYLNDPQEGQVFLDYFLSQARKRKKDNPFMKQLCLSYEKVSEKRSDVYIASFTNNADSLPLWSMYGDDGKGISLTLSADSFQKETDKSMEREDKFMLQKVHYVKLKSEQKDTEAFKDFCGQLLEKLDVYSRVLTEQMESLEEQEQKEMVEIAVNAAVSSIDRCRFLFKDITYKHEEEYRLISIDTHPLPDYKDLELGQDMRLFVELDRKLHYDFLTIGPNCPQENVVRQLALHSDFVRQVKISEIKYRG